MIKGLDKFKEHFAGFADHYVLIGGAASVVVMDGAGVDFRATKDLDIVLCVEALDVEFAKAFWAFVKAGNYQNQQRSTDKKIFYRFNEPEDKNYPFMLELFSRTPDMLVLGDGSNLTPIPVEENVDSLSAILLDENYYQFMHQHKVEIDGVPVVTEVGLIPLKAKAWLDLTMRKEAGEKIDSKNIKKHKNDIFRLFQIISPELRIDLHNTISQDMHQYFAAIADEKDLSLKNFGLKGLGVLEVIETLREVYKIPV